jgi:hypothetical protein
LVENLLPLGAGLWIVQAAIHHGPALNPMDLVLQQPQIDVVQGERQRHAVPKNTLYHFNALAGRGQGVTQGIVQFLFEQIHRGILLDN